MDKLYCPLCFLLQQNITIKNYNPKYLEQLSFKLQGQKVNTLVVGHSNTTQRLARLLTKKTLLH
jgi:hypothetical protein